ncbi:MAG: prepilin-type cleavage/methylation domain-containing protein [Methylotenera sp.]|nr:MAG: prepilin-type cleavage/methylation domain-containing protein [Methylotenera sp.]
MGFKRNGAGFQQGFSLIEMMVVVTIMAILASVAFPAFDDALLSTKLRSYANNFIASTHLARSEAIKRNAVVTLCVSTNGTSCGAGGWEQGWLILSGASVLQYQQATASGYKITEANGIDSLSFQPTGIGVTQATLTFCRATSSTGEQKRVVTLSSSGRASVSKTSAGAC